MFSWFLLCFIAITAILGVLAAIDILRDRKALSLRTARLQELKQSLTIDPASHSRFAVPAILTHEKWAEFEASVRDLIQVIVVADTVDQPVNGLQRAVLENFKRGVKYLFIVSSSKAEQELTGFYKLFEGLANAAITKLNVQSTVRDLVSIKCLSHDWDNVPYIFYRTQAKNCNHAVTIAFRGDVENAGIANRYVAVDPDTAEAMFKFMMGDPPKEIVSALIGAPENEKFIDFNTIVGQQRSIAHENQAG
jgi:hypothetical protein